MDKTVYKGTISFVHHDKQYVTIDYISNGKKKSLTSKINKDDASQKTGKKHRYRIGDEVNFQLRPSDRGDKLVAYNLKFLYNTALEILVNKAAIENRFAGYLKVVDDVLYVKEQDSYIFFPLKLSKWENPPAASALNETISFKLVNLDKPTTIAAELFSHDYFPEYRKAVESFNKKTAIEAIVSKVSPYAVYLDLFGNKVQAKMQPATDAPELKTGDQLKVKIKYISSDRIAVEPIVPASS